MSRVERIDGGAMCYGRTIRTIGKATYRSGFLGAGGQVVEDRLG